MSALAVVPAASVCPACGGRQRVLLADPGSPLFTVVPCLGCVWGVPVADLPQRGDR